MRVYGYTRVSTEEQGRSGLGLEAQADAMRAWCALHGHELAAMYQDTGSGRDTARPRLQEALRGLRQRQAAGLVVAKLDRLSRSVRDFADLAQLAARQRWSIICLDLQVDTSTPSGEAMANVMVTFAQLERRLIGQRTKEALAVRRSQGVRLGRPVQLLPKVEAFILELRQQGASHEAIAAQLNSRRYRPVHGGSRWYRSTVQRVLERHPEAPKFKPGRRPRIATA